MLQIINLTIIYNSSKLHLSGKIVLYQTVLYKTVLHKTVCNKTVSKDGW